jgi:tetratricopeptide (TPR) repeat protein
MRVLVLLLLLLLGVASSSRADSVSDVRQASGAFYSGDYDKSIELYSRAIDSNELNGARLAAAYRGRGEANFKNQDFDAAIQDLTLAIGLDSSASNLEECYRWRARAYDKTDQRGQAIDDWRKLAYVHPGDSEAMRALIRLGEKPGILP